MVEGMGENFRKDKENGRFMADVGCLMSDLSMGISYIFIASGMLLYHRIPAARSSRIRLRRLFHAELRSNGEYNFTGIQHSFTIAGVGSCRAKSVKEKKEKRRAAAQRTDLWLPFLHSHGWH
jgi:hypothetical protein